MRRILVIGIGPGDPEQLTLQAIAALNRVDVFFVLDKGEVKADLLELRKQICTRFVQRPNYRIVEVPDPVRDERIASYSERVAHWHEERARLIAQQLTSELGPDECAGFLVWGDPALYDSTLRVLERVRRDVELECEVIPGISSVQLLAARHRIALHPVAAPVYITTGRRLAEQRALPADGDLVVMLDGECAWKTLETHENLEIFWGAYLGTERELLVSGPLRERSREIEALRAKARAEHGWIMDTYLIRRSR
jgi:precorrin-6A synthase